MTKPHAHTLILPADFAFAVLQATLEQGGWRLATLARAPIVPGEPEHAAFVQQSRQLVYTFNPVCRLRVLDTAHAGALPPGLPFVHHGDLAEWLASNDERTVLRGILAAQATGDTALLNAVQAQRQHPRAAIAQAAERAAQVLQQAPPADPPSDPNADIPPGPAPDARATALAAADVLRHQLEPLLLSVARDPEGELAASLLPRDEDWARAFVPEVAEAARQAYAAAWPSAPRVTRAGAQARALVHVAPAGMLTHPNPLSRDFPGGYQAIARLLQPQRVWAAWKMREPGASAGMAYDGLVWLDDHWAWFPKPYRVLADLVRT
ncbi:hypothetical protein [Hydrogenophaga sp.]|uniref:hypothetical protein n=1 Tax=Hydrogenophaga sp. TaxID=1904254 RepID=UPI00356AB372